jgi:NAD(P)-dependent dehydrogenase (short-subunit alcohol dehydrogenase family)
MPPHEAPSAKPLAGKFALVTGGTGGIGGGIAVALADAGCQVIATGCETDELERFDDQGRGVHRQLLDVASPTQIGELVGGLSRLDILVNAAGIILRNGREHDPLDFARVIDVNLTGTMRMCAACHPLLAKAGGTVLNLASMLSFFGSGYVPGYSASKGGIVQLTKSLAIAWAKDNIRVNALAPGWIETPLTQALRESPERSREILNRTPLGRWGRPEDLAGAAVFLCSSSAAFITGVTLPVDGGYSIS